MRRMPARLPALLAAPPPGPAPLWLTNARLLDGTGAPPREGASVLVRDGRIELVAGAADAPPGDASAIDLEGRTLMPGLVDAHAHVKAKLPQPDEGAEPLLPGTSAHVVAAHLAEALRRGVTTVRDVGSFGSEVVEARQAMRLGAFRGPRLLTCGRIVSATSPGGRFFSGMYREADGPDDIRRAVREQLRHGADFIKLMTTGARSVELEDPDPAQVTGEEVAALVEEAHRLGYRVAAHAEGLPGTELAIDGRDRHDRARHVPQPAARPARPHGRAGAGARADALVLLRRRRARRRGRRGARDLEPAAGGARAAQPRAGRPDTARGARRRGEDRARPRLGAVLRQRAASSSGWCTTGFPRWRRSSRRPRRAPAALGLGDELGTVEAGRIADL